MFRIYDLTFITNDLEGKWTGSFETDDDVKVVRLLNDAPSFSRLEMPISKLVE